MTDNSVTPIFSPQAPTPPLGRRADLLAMSLAALGAGLSLISAIWFFLGFAENDTRPEHLTSALVLTLLLFAFAILPFACTAWLARRAYAKGTRRAHLFWALFLMLPWIGLGVIAAVYTPLPGFVGLIMAGLAALLSLWAVVSLVLDWNAAPPEPLDTKYSEMSGTPDDETV